ncbi:hypothetical protein AB0K00_13810 [Dactylosporangium sp. NPDC049525]
MRVPGNHWHDTWIDEDEDGDAAQVAVDVRSGPFGARFVAFVALAWPLGW